MVGSAFTPTTRLDVKIYPALRNRQKGYAYFLGNKMYIIIIIILREEHSIYAGRLADSATKENFI